jgi:hypothetical protein
MVQGRREQAVWELAWKCAAGASHVVGERFWCTRGAKQPATPLLLQRRLLLLLWLLLLLLLQRRHWLPKQAACKRPHACERWRRQPHP